MELAQPAPIVEEALAEAPKESDRVKVKPAEIQERPEPKSALVVAPATTDYNKFAPKTSTQEASSLSVAVLKKQGTDFESEAAVIKGCVEKIALRRWLPMIYDERDFVSYGEVRRYVFVKGNCIFVYGQKYDPKPLFVIQLESIRAEIEDPNKPHKNSYSISPQAGTKNLPSSNMVTVLLMDKNSIDKNSKGYGKQLYQITFDNRNDKSVVKRFMDILRTNAKHYGGEVVSASVVEAISKMDIKDDSKK